MSATLIRKVHDVAYHRNGISGVGFFVVDFTARDQGRRMLGIVFHDRDDPEDERCYSVINPADIRDKYRGDHFIKELDAAIATAGDKAFG